MTSTTLGRREMKKRETHDSLIASALALFASDGYQSTTVAAIASRAGVSARTFFAYFPTKEAVLFWPLDMLREDLEETLSKGEEDALTTLRDWVHTHSAWFDSDFRALRRLIEAASKESQTVALTGLLFIQRVSEAVAARLRLDLGSDMDDAMPEMAAAAAVAALTVALPMGMTSRSGQAGRDRSGNLFEDLDAAIAFARAGLDATRPTFS